MRRRDDDLSPFRDDPLFRALTGPATPDELAGEADARSAFRAAFASRPRRRFAARVGASGTAAIAAVVLSGGVAAAYTASLPAPLQEIAHDAVPGVPAPHHVHHKSNGSTSASGRSTGSTPVVSPTPAPSASSADTPAPRATPATVASASAAVTPTTTPTVPVVVATPPITPTPTPTRTSVLKGATLAITVSATKIAVGGSVTVTGQLDAADATPIAGRKVVLRERLPGVPGVTRLGPQLSSSTGQVTFTVADLAHNVRLMLHTGRHVQSTVARVVILPAISETVTPSSTTPGAATLTVTVQGGQEGDVVVVSRAGGKKRLEGALDSNGVATFTIAIPTHRAVQYRIFLPRTPAHGMASLQLQLSPG